MSPAAKFFDTIFAGYQKLRAGRPSPCRHVPSCSVYGREAVQFHGATKGVYLTTKRILRCNPWGSEGYDPVPGTETKDFDTNTDTFTDSKFATNRKVASH